MNLEAIEQKCLAYLKQVSRPLVPVDQLLRYLWRDEAFANVSERELLEFLRNHELFTVLDPIGLAAGPEGARALDEAGISVGPSVILEARIPAKGDLAAQMDAQLETLIASLETALGEAQEVSSAQRRKMLEALLSRASSLRERLKSLG